MHMHTVCTQVNEAAEIIYDMVDPNANLIFGAVVDTTLPEDTISITIIATGFGNVEPELGALGDRRAAPAARPAAASQAPGARGTDTTASGVEIPAFLKRRRMQGMK